MLRPHPPQEMFEPDGPAFLPSPDLEAWARSTFIDPDADLLNEEHAHLNQAALGFCWTVIPNSRAGQRIVGQCEIMPPMAMGKWAKARAEQQIEEWFGQVPDFVITLDALYCEQAEDATFLAIVEHELLHCGQERDQYGAPKFTRDGRPKFGIRGHDCEEFVSIVRRYGPGHAAGATAALVEAARQPPLISRASVANACGTCRMLRAA